MICDNFDIYQSALRSSYLQIKAHSFPETGGLDWVFSVSNFLYDCLLTKWKLGLLLKYEWASTHLRQRQFYKYQHIQKMSFNTSLNLHLLVYKSVLLVLLGNRRKNTLSEQSSVIKMVSNFKFLFLNVGCLFFGNYVIKCTSLYNDLIL